MIEYGDCKECKHNAGCPHKPKSLAQYLSEYIEHEYKTGQLIGSNKTWSEFLEQALDAYELTENVVVQIIKKKVR